MIKQSHFWNLPIVHKGMLQKSDTEVDISSEGGDIHFSHSLYHEGAFAPESLWFLVVSVQAYELCLRWCRHTNLNVLICSHSKSIKP